MRALLQIVSHPEIRKTEMVAYQLDDEAQLLYQKGEILFSNVLSKFEDHFEESEFD